MLDPGLQHHGLAELVLEVGSEAPRRVVVRLYDGKVLRGDLAALVEDAGAVFPEPCSLRGSAVGVRVGAFTELAVSSLQNITRTRDTRRRAVVSALRLTSKKKVRGGCTSMDLALNVLRGGVLVAKIVRASRGECVARLMLSCSRRGVGAAALVAVSRAALMTTPGVCHTSGGTWHMFHGAPRLSPASKCSELMALPAHSLACR
jgi:hypothetical protein